MRVLVCGGREFNDYGKVSDTLCAIHQETGISCVIHGGARGADHLASEWAKIYCVGERVEFADWDQHGKAAGPIRNQRMLDVYLPNLVVAFPGGRGTDDMVRRAEKAGVKVMRVTVSEEGSNNES